MTDLGKSISKLLEKTRCEICDYTACKKSDYTRHLATRKHKKRADLSQNAQKILSLNCDDTTSVKHILYSSSSSQLQCNVVLKSISKILEKKRCEICDYTTTRKSNFINHLHSNRHKQKSKEANNKKYLCEICNYSTNLKQNIAKHLTSKKHLENNIILSNDNDNQNENENDYDSENDCENNSVDANESDNDSDNASITNKLETSQLDELKYMDTSLDQIDNNLLMNIIMKLSDRNEKLENIVVQQNELITKQTELSTRQTELTTKQTEMTSKQTEILDVISKKDFGNTTNNNNSHNTTNNTANINIFLNEKCGGAMNMTEFIESLQYSIETLKDMGRNGFAHTVTSIFKKRLNELTIYERPIHCTDVKREVLYIKDNDEWQKDTKEKNMRDVMINKYIPMIEKDNLKEFCKWGREHPEIHEIGNPEYEPYFSIAREVNNGRNKEINDVKIIKNICKETQLSKNMIKEL